MSLIDKIENIQRKPEHIKRRILFVSVTFFMFVIVAAWVSTLKLASAKKDFPEGKEAIASPVSVFSGILSDGLAAGVSELKQSIRQVSE